MLLFLLFFTASSSYIRGLEFLSVSMTGATKSLLELKEELGHRYRQKF